MRCTPGHLALLQSEGPQQGPHSQVGCYRPGPRHCEEAVPLGSVGFSFVLVFLSIAYNGVEWRGKSTSLGGRWPSIQMAWQVLLGQARREHGAKSFAEIRMISGALIASPSEAPPNRGAGSEHEVTFSSSTANGGCGGKEGVHERGRKEGDCFTILPRA